MRSGNGRHRRPRQAPALFVTAGVTGASLAMPLLAAGSAQAADGATWDRVAECESGGLWSANAGNGYYGGLQLTLETWEEYGGTVLADRPDLASRGQQIEIAERILADRGPRAWPSCSISAGLIPDEQDESGPDLEPPELPEVPDSELPEVPDVPEVEIPDRPDGSQGGSRGDETDAPSGDVPSGNVPSGEGASGDGSNGEGASGDDATAPAPDGTNGTGSGVGEPDPEATPRAPHAPDARDGGGAGRHRGDPDDRSSEEADRAARGGHDKPDASAKDSHRVRPGDSLSAIAAEHDLRGGWTGLYESNRETVGDDPDLILPGQLLDLRTGGELR